MRVNFFYLENIEIPAECDTYYYAGASRGSKDLTSSRFNEACLFSSKETVEKIRKNLNSKYKIVTFEFFPLEKNVEQNQEVFLKTSTFSNYNKAMKALKELQALLEPSSEEDISKSQKIIALEHELKVTEEILADRQRLLDAIPQCESHGKCVPHALEWIEKSKTIRKKFKQN